MARYDAQAVRDAATGRWVGILSTLAPELTDALPYDGGSRTPRHKPCPVHGGKDGFRVFRDVDQTGGGVCNTCGIFSDGFALLGWLRGWGFVETLRAVAETLGMSPTAKSPIILPRPMPVKPASRPRQEAARKLWQASWPLDHPAALVARRYLWSRGLDVTVVLSHIDPATLRFHPEVAYYDGESPKPAGTFPALLAAVRDAKGRALTLHRTYLACDGAGKAPVTTAKKLVSTGLSLRGAAVRLGVPRHGHLGVAEGLETALAALQWQGHGVWSCVSGALLAAFEPPADVTHVTIWADKDRAVNERDKRHVGEHYAHMLAERLIQRGMAVEIVLPRYAIPDHQKGLDWADVLAYKGLEGFTQRRHISAA